MLPTHIRWSSIELLHNVIRTINYLAETGVPRPALRYRAKVKLHGTNAGVQVTPSGVFAQSRSKMLSVSADSKGFARWVAQTEPFFAGIEPGTTVFGEWCGPGVERGVAISAIPDKVFAIFALQQGRDEAARFITEPTQIRARIGAHPSVHVLPWCGESIALDFSDAADLERKAEVINRLVAAVEGEDPWVKRTFGIGGVGEGLVFYPQGDLDPERLFRLMFKAKGSKHQTVGRKPARTKAVVASGVPEFVRLVVTEARLQQGLAEACGGEASMRHTGAFLRWVVADTRRESVAELEAAGLSWARVQRAVQTRAREWLKARC